jgi:hypothetical protein
LTQSPDDPDENGEATTVVTDAWPTKYRALALHFDVGALRENRIQVSGNHDTRSHRCAWSIAAHVPGVIDVDVPKTQTFENLPEQIATSAFLEAWRWYFTNPYLIINGLWLSGPRCFHRGFD